MRIHFGSVLLGVVADKLLFIVSVVLLSTVAPTTSAAFSAAALASGFACTTLGAFVAATRAG